MAIKLDIYEVTVVQDGEMFAKPETTVREGVSRYVSLKPLDIFNNMLGNLSTVLVETIPNAFHKILVQDGKQLSARDHCSR